LGLLASLLLSACTLVPTDPAPRTVNSADIPSGLLNGVGTKQLATVAFWYFDPQGYLVQRWARVAAPVTIVNLAAHLARRVPSDLTTAVSSNMVISRAVVRGDEATLFVTGGFRASDPATDMRALRQLVATLRNSFGISTLNVTDVKQGRTLTIDASGL
ncbi:MAG: hypothetical protein WCG62_05305, partial [Actinomycetes bacterium]